MAGKLTERPEKNTILLSRDASVLIVENNDTCDHNSEYAQLLPEHRLSIREIAKLENIRI
jgi:hypothetical protein